MSGLGYQTTEFRSKTEFRQSLVLIVRLLPHSLFLPRNYVVCFSHLF